MVWHNIYNARTFYSLLTSFSQTESECFWIPLPKYTSQSQNNNVFFFSGIINLLFDGLAYNTSGHFAHCSYFFSSLRGSEKTTQLAKYPHVLCAKPSNKVYVLNRLWLYGKNISSESPNKCKFLTHLNPEFWPSN